MDFEQEEYGLMPEMAEERQVGPFSRVRFFHGAAGYGPMNIQLGDMNVNQLEFGVMSSFASVPEGFSIVTLSSSRMPRIALLRRRILFPAGAVLTMAIVNSPEGLDMIMVPEL